MVLILKYLFSFAFVEVKSLADVEKAILKTNNYKLDKSHTLLVNRWSDLERLQKVEEEYVPPEIDDFQPKVSLSLLRGVLGVEHRPRTAP